MAASDDTKGGSPTHKWRWLWWVLGAILLLLVIASAVLYPYYVAPKPTPFYTPPNPLPSGNPGDIIRVEPVTGELPKGAQAWRILYLSTDPQGEPVAVSGMVYAPIAQSDTPRPVLAWAHGTTGIVPKCAPSLSPKSTDHSPELDTLMAQGFVVAATDYPGLGTPGMHPYLVGPSEATAVLDSVRAARKLETNASDEYVIWGASQGGHAALWSAQMAEEYAPELTLRAVAASAPAIDLAGIFDHGMDHRTGAIVISEAIYAWSHYYPDINLDDIIKPELRKRFDEIAQTCITTPLRFETGGGIPVPEEFLTIDPLTTEPYKTLLAENSPVGEISVPILISHGTGDTLIPIEGSENAVAQRCIAGETIEFMRYPGINHPALPQSSLTTIGWLQDRLTGGAVPSSC